MIPRRRSRRRFHRGQCTAATRAVTGARLYASGAVQSFEAAAICTGSNVGYVRAALVVVRAEDSELLGMVMAGSISLPAAAAQVRGVSRLMHAYREADTGARVIFGRTVGSDNLLELACAAS